MKSNDNSKKEQEGNSILVYLSSLNQSIEDLNHTLSRVEHSTAKISSDDSRLRSFQKTAEALTLLDIETLQSGISNNHRNSLKSESLLNEAHQVLTASKSKSKTVLALKASLLIVFIGISASIGAWNDPLGFHLKPNFKSHSCEERGGITHQRPTGQRLCYFAN